MTVFVFDIETVPDIASGKKLYDLADLADEAVADALFALQRAKSGHSFLPHYLQRIVAISIVLYNPQELKVWSLGTEEAPESELVARFFAGVEKYTPQLVSWNGAVLIYPFCITAPFYTALPPPPIGKPETASRVFVGITT